jgi:hypothetical protein
MAFATARLIALRSALADHLFTASDPAPIGAATRQCGVAGAENV